MTFPLPSRQGLQYQRKQGDTKFTVKSPEGDYDFYNFTDAQECAGILAGRHIKQPIVIHKNDSPEAFFTSRKFFSDDDPRWKVIPNIDQCRLVYTKIITQAIFDATLGKAFGAGVTDSETRKSHYTSKLYLYSERFKSDCEFADIDHSSVMKAMEKYKICPFAKAA
jgi:hypothetical protein